MARGAKRSLREVFRSLEWDEAGLRLILMRISRTILLHASYNDDWQDQRLQRLATAIHHVDTTITIFHILAQ